MTRASRAVATAITVSTEQGIFLVLGAPDPRTRGAEAAGQ